MRWRTCLILLLLAAIPGAAESQWSGGNPYNEQREQRCLESDGYWVTSVTVSPLTNDCSCSNCVYADQTNICQKVTIQGSRSAILTSIDGTYVLEAGLNPVTSSYTTIAPPGDVYDSAPEGPGYCVQLRDGGKPVWFDGSSRPTFGMNVSRYPRTFFGPGVKHDNCYHHANVTYGWSRARCDANYLTDMISACDQRFGLFELDRYDCLTAATHENYPAVVFFGVPSWEAANVKVNYRSDVIPPHNTCYENLLREAAAAYSSGDDNHLGTTAAIDALLSLVEAGQLHCSRFWLLAWVALEMDIYRQLGHSRQTSFGTDIVARGPREYGGFEIANLADPGGRTQSACLVARDKYSLGLSGLATEYFVPIRTCRSGESGCFTDTFGSRWSAGLCWEGIARGEDFIDNEAHAHAIAAWGYLYQWKGAYRAAAMIDTFRTSWIAQVWSELRQGIKSRLTRR